MSRGITTCACGEPAYDGLTQCSLCSTDGGLFTPAPGALPDVPYSGLEERFFKNLNTITRRAVLQALGGHSDALMEEVRNHSDERRLFKHLFKAAPPAQAQPVAVPDGWQLVPIYPTNIMLQNADANPIWKKPESALTVTAEKAWRNMLAVAPKPPTAAPAAQGDASPTYAKHGYILEAADGHQTWLKGDPADGMGRYGKVIQVYKKEST